MWFKDGGVNIWRHHRVLKTKSDGDGDGNVDICSNARLYLLIFSRLEQIAARLSLS